MPSFESCSPTGTWTEKKGDDDVEEAERETCEDARRT